MQHVPMPFPPSDRYTWARDNVRLHWQDWHGPADAPDDRPVLLCVPGLTRNLRDFAALAARISDRFRVVTVSLRGRGESGYATDKLSYVPFVYLQDLGSIIADAGIRRLVLLGTSLGAMLGLMLPMTHRDAMAGLVLNDLGPTVQPEGLARVREQIRRRGDGWASWLQAARDMAQRQADIYPQFGLDEWLAHVKRLCRVSREGRILFDYDPQIAAPMDLPHNDEAVDLWAAFDGLKQVPMLSIRGARSDILSAETQIEMASRHPNLATVTVPDVGHAPTLDEPESVAAIDRFLAQFLA